MCVWGLFQPGYYTPLDVASVDRLAAQIFVQFGRKMERLVAGGQNIYNLACSLLWTL